MSPRYLSHGFWRVSAKLASEAILNAVPNSAGRLPKPGHEAWGQLGKYRVWVARTLHDGKLVWSVRSAESGHDVEFRRCMEAWIS